MEWAQILALFLANASLIVWFRSESRADFRALDTKIDANRAETRTMIAETHAKIDSYRAETHAKIDSYREETRALIDGIQMEMKDFHGRLCALEERRARRDEEGHPW